MENNASTLDSKVLEKIQKLMALAADKGATQGEIENATRKVQEILFKYNLSIADVDAHVNPEEILIENETIDFASSWKKSEGNWISSLYYAVAKYNMCQVVLDPYSRLNPSGGNKKMYTSLFLIGKPSNVDIVHYLCVQLIPQIRRVEKDAFRDYTGYEKRGTFRRGFLVGCVQGIKRQLYNQEKAFREASQKTDAMVVVNDQAVDLFMRKEFKGLGKGRRSSLSSYEGRSRGLIAGESMGLRPGVTEGRTGSGGFGGLLGQGN